MTRNIWFWSDQHNGHANIISFMRKDGVTRLRPEFYDEASGVRDVRRMGEYMVERYNSAVKPPDEVWFGGDVAFTPHAFTSLMRRLVPCAARHLILGNHDRLDMPVYLQHFNSVRVEKTFRDQKFILTHYPVHQSCLSSAVRVNVHGHTHANEVMAFDNGHAFNHPDPRYVNICVEHTDYGPVHIDELAARARRV